MRVFSSLNVELTRHGDEQLLEFLLKIRHRVERTLEMLDKR